jgi:UDP-N-acetylmuramate dehydrogenase
MMALQRNNGLRGELLHNEPMAPYTSWRAGGVARDMYRPADREDLLLFLRSLPAAEEIIFLGLGSNLLVRDGGVQGTVICMQGVLTDISVIESSAGEARVYAGAGAPCAQLARFGAQQELAGSEFFAGIPGTVGGALAMNAGAFGSETWGFVEQVESVDRRGVVVVRKPADYQIAYRHVQGPRHEWFLGGFFRFKRDPDKAGKQRIKDLLNKRSSTQPIGVYSCGSVFRNPPGDYAARLIDTAGLKGYRIGGAHVSEKHANFIINDADASARDIEELIFYVQARVESAHGVRLQPEVHIIGEPA